MGNAKVHTARGSWRRSGTVAAPVTAAVLAGTLALTSCGSGDKSAGTGDKKPTEHHTVVLEATSDYGRPIAINYFGTATGPKGMTTIGEKGKGDLSAASPWKVTLTVNGKDPWIHLSANGTGCIGRATGGDSCATGTIPDAADIEGKGITTCRITIDGKVVAEESYTYPVIIPVTCLTPRGDKTK
ncbi:hypothetical protein ABZ682_23775 [Streptomyces griseoviridis]|uniref:hypothetical protein n=1 Tax=Streptomyces griseoviridis TaxID=45398 RepID=UPI0033C0BDC9